MEMLSVSRLGSMIRGYTLEKLLAQETLTATYLAHTEEIWLEQELNITLFSLPERLSIQERARFAERFSQTARALMKLRHPSLLPLYGYGDDAGIPYLLRPTMPPAITLTQQIQEHQQWAPSEAFKLLAPLCSALAYIHDQGFVYQFLSPSAIMLTRTGSIQIIELGMAQLLRSTGLEELEDAKKHPTDHLKDLSGSYLGQPEYLAPEIVRGEAATPRSDIYSLGIILFELLSGTLPFTGDNYLDTTRKHVRTQLPSIHTIAPDVPIALELVVNRALHRNPANRFPTIGAFLKALSQVIDERLHIPTSNTINDVIQQMYSLSFTANTEAPYITPTRQQG